MSITGTIEQAFTGQFTPLTLDALNSKAPMLTRQDQKYILDASDLAAAAPLLAAAFEILEIGSRRSFLYETIYFDDLALANFHDHRRGRRRRFKARTRLYVDMNQCYLEMKMKGPRARTIKRRAEHPVTHSHLLDAGALDTLAAWYEEEYRVRPTLELVPTLKTLYRRVTLVAKYSAERLTIDGHLHFAAGETTVQPNSGKFLLETKSPRGHGIADRILRGLGHRPVGRCSKYCIGLLATGRARSGNRFLPALRRLQLRPSAWMPEPKFSAIMLAAPPSTACPIGAASEVGDARPSLGPLGGGTGRAALITGTDS